MCNHTPWYCGKVGEPYEEYKGRYAHIVYQTTQFEAATIATLDNPVVFNGFYIDFGEQTSGSYTFDQENWFTKSESAWWWYPENEVGSNNAMMFVWIYEPLWVDEYSEGHVQSSGFLMTYFIPVRFWKQYDSEDDRWILRCNMARLKENNLVRVTDVFQYGTIGLGAALTFFTLRKPSKDENAMQFRSAYGWAPLPTYLQDGEKFSNLLLPELYFTNDDEVEILSLIGQIDTQTYYVEHEKKVGDVTYTVDLGYDNGASLVFEDKPSVGVPVNFFRWDFASQWQSYETPYWAIVDDNGSLTAKMPVGIQKYTDWNVSIDAAKLRKDEKEPESPFIVVEKDSDLKNHESQKKS